MDATLTNTLTWQAVLEQEKDKDYFKQILAFIDNEREQGKAIYPAKENTFNALKLTPFANLKVVILGQDPYHGPNQAMGLSFSVNKGVTPPPSLVNIYKELHNDLGVTHPGHGDLTHWAKQGVLLLNATLTVEAHKASSHSHIGWQTFTDTIIQRVNQHPEPIVFLLWGAYAQKKSSLIDTNIHAILKAPHPSPLSAYRGFLGCQHFSKTNALLKAHHRSPIDWQLPSL